MYIWVPKKKSNSPAESNKIKNDPEAKKTRSSQYSDKFKQSVVVTYISSGRNMNLTCRLTGLPLPTLKFWRTCSWWNDYEKEVIDQANQETSNKLQQIINKSLDQVMDRITNGDHILDSKTGKVLRVPMKGKDINTMITHNVSKKILLDNIQSQKVEQKNEEKQAETLLRLAEKFAQIASGRHQNEIRTITESIGDAHIVYEHKLADAITNKDLKSLQEAIKSD